MKRKTQRRGFTLIEMIVVTAILAMMAALVIPNMVAIRQTREERDEVASIGRLPQIVRNLAVKLKSAVSMRVEGDDFVLEHQNSDTNETEEIKRVPLGRYVTVTGAQLNGNTTDLASWKWQAYPDGTSDNGALILKIGNRSAEESLYMPADGAARWVDGEPPQPSDDFWAAGVIQPRDTTTGTGGGGGNGGKGGGAKGGGNAK